MTRLIIGLENAGHAFFNAVIQYCQTTGQPVRPDIYNTIYHECISQILSTIHNDFQTFMANLMTLPVWTTIHFREEPVDHQASEPFKNEVRAMGIFIYHRLHSKGNLDDRNLYLLESCSPSVAVIAICVDSSLL